MQRHSPLSDMDDLWVKLPRPTSSGAWDDEPMSERVRRVDKDLSDLNKYYNLSISGRRYARLREWYQDELQSLYCVDFDALNQQDKVDFLLLRNFFRRNARELELEWEALHKVRRVVPFAHLMVEMLDARQDVEPMQPDVTAEKLDVLRKEVLDVMDKVENGKVTTNKLTGFKAAKVIDQLHQGLKELYSFYAGYDPMFDWWVAKPFQDVDTVLGRYLILVQTKLAGMNLDAEEDDIVGEPIGREALLVELEAEMIAYTPEKLVALAYDQFGWCEEQMRVASRELGFGDEWKDALEHVKKQFVPPGEQTQLTKDLALEGADYVKKHNLVTVPRISDETYRMIMIPPERQAWAPFFLGGELIQVAYPRRDMAHGMKKMVMRGNNRHFARATAFHELIPGHRLQLYMADRYRSHRWLFATPFTIEGWGMYWEMNFWQRGDFFVSPGDRIGTLFWRMHRCARIILSLRFHLGEMDPQECVDVLVDWVGHERSTAESEVRRWFGGDYAPLYQAGYMLGALQLMALRKEAVVDGGMEEREFNDRVLRCNMMPIELMRALILGLELSPEYKPHWKFYKGREA